MRPLLIETTAGNQGEISSTFAKSDTDIGGEVEKPILNYWLHHLLEVHFVAHSQGAPLLAITCIQILWRIDHLPGGQWNPRVAFRELLPPSFCTAQY